nr:hypothetical protein BaRGS_005436 [Batillaria attramentaria]
MADKTAPDSQLRLEWVYGYRGHQCRNNLQYNANKDLVYFVAGVGIVYNVRDNKQRFFLGHDDDIRLVSVGMDQHATVNVWDWRKGKIIATARGHSDKVFDIQFHPFKDNTIVSCGVKHIKFWSLSGNTLTPKKGVFGKVGDIQTMLCLAFGADGATYSGTLSGDVYIWNENNLDRVGPVYTMDSSEDGFATGGKDGVAKLWDADFKNITAVNLVNAPGGYKGDELVSLLLVGTQDSEIFEVQVKGRDKPLCVVQGHAEGELWALAVHPKKPIFATGSDDQTVRLWNMNNREVLSRTSVEQKVRSCAFDAEGQHLALGMTDGDLSELIHIKDRKEVIHEMKFSPCGKYLAVGSNDNFVDIYAVEQRYKRVGTCSGSSSFITHLDWSQDSKFLQTNSGAGERLFFRMPAGKQVTSTEEIQSIHWATFTGVLGAEVNGIWEKYTDTNDVNATDANFAGQVTVTGDDFGLVKLFRFPCLKKAYVDSNSEDSDSDLSDVGEVDSDVEREKQVKYGRHVYREDAAQIKKFRKQEMKPGEKRALGPNDGLKLEHVHGYRGYDCRNNLFYTQTGEVVYHVAAVGIIFNKEKNQQRFYTQHSDDILCLCIHPLKDLIATGQTADVCFSGGSDGNVFIWGGITLQKVVKAHEGPVFAMHSLDKGFVTGGKDGVIGLWDDQFERCLKTYAIKKAAIAPESKGILTSESPSVRAIVLGHGKILVGTMKGEILEVDKAGPMTILAQGHSQGELWGLATHPSKAMYATVSDDRTLRVWTYGDSHHQLVNIKQLKQAGRCVAFSPDGKALAVGLKDDPGKYLAVASHDNFVDIYSVLGTKRVGTCKGASSYITHVDWDVRGKVLMVNSGAKEMLFYEAPRGKRITLRSTEVEKFGWSTWTCVLGATCEGVWPAKSDVTDVNATSLSPDKSLLATADDFGFVKLFRYPAKGKFAKFKKYAGHSAHVTNVRWTQDGRKVISTGGADTAVMVWASQTAAERRGVQGESDDSDTDSEEEGYDSDVEREKKIDYSGKIFATSVQEKAGVRPNMQKMEEEEKPAVSRNAPEPPKVKKVEPVTTGGKKRKTTQVTDLELNYIHGYRGFDARSNLYYVNDGAEIVFHAAGAGAQSFYLKHTDDIIALSVNQHPKHRNIVATAQIGNPPTVHIWDATSKETLSILQGVHSGGICSLDFSCTGKMLLTVGLEDEHNVAVWRWQDVFTMFTTLRDGLIVTGGKELPTKDSGPVKLWDQEMKRCRAFPLRESGSKADVIKSVCRYKGKILVGTRDNDIYEVNEKSGSITVLMAAHAEGLLWGLDCHPTSSRFITAGFDNTLRMWDLQNRSLLAKLEVGAARSASFSSDGELIAVGLKTGEFVLLTTAGLKLWGRKRDRSAPINDINLNVFELEIWVSTGAYINQVFVVPAGNLVEDDAIINKITWNTWSSVLGKEVVGIWPKDSTKADVNCAHLSNLGNALATGDDFGHVKLFEFPCPDKLSITC